MKDYHLYKPFRNNLRKLNGPDVLVYIIDKLHMINKNPIEKWEGFYPWELLLVIKWIFLGSRNATPNQIQVGDSDILKLINIIKDIANERTPEFYREDIKVTNILRKLAHQQFWTQKKYNTGHIGRQYSSFCCVNRVLFFPHS